MIVVDASVAAKWFVDEPGSDTAAELLTLNAPALAGPDLLLVEVVATLVRLANQRSMSKDEAAARIARWTAAWQAGHVRRYRLDEQLIARAAEIAIGLGHPLKDCIYLALALDLGCRLLTADARFRQRALPHYPVVDLLASATA